MIVKQNVVILAYAEGLDGGKRLYSDLFDGYNREVLPRRLSTEGVVVDMEMHLNRLIDVVSVWHVESTFIHSY